MSGAVGSMPSLTRRDRPKPSFRSSSPSGRQSTALRASQAATSAGLDELGVVSDNVLASNNGTVAPGPMLDSRAPHGSLRRRVPVVLIAAFRLEWPRRG